MRNYRSVSHRFLGYLRAAFPRVRQLSQLRRDPHMLGWFRWLCEQDPPLGNSTRAEHLLCLRRLLDDLAIQGHPIRPGLIIREDFPVRPEYLPRPLSPEDDQRLQEELRGTDNLYSNALLLTRATGIRIGECIHLPLDCRRHVGPEQWALHVPLGKLHTERLVPLDAEGLRLLQRLLELRAMASPTRLAKSEGFLLPRIGGRFALFQTLRLVLADAAKRAGCADTSPISPHRLRHTWATEMLRCGISLPALMQLMGHKDIRMTLRYLKVAQPDLQREFYKARQNTAQAYPLPPLTASAFTSDLPGIRQALAATRHLLEMYRRQFSDDKTQRRLQRLDRRLLDVAQQLQRIAAGGK
ncbi:MAG: tyrosine-type recombinase/integrase [Bryobacteraceae bacterium]